MCGTALPSTPLPVPAKSVRFAAEAPDAASHGRLLDITVLSICGEEMASVHASEDCTVASLKTAIAAQSSVPTAAQELILDSCVLDDGQLMSEVLEAAFCVGQSVLTLTLIVVSVDPFPKLYIEACGTQWTAQRAEQTPKTLLCEDMVIGADTDLWTAVQCKECDGPLQEKTRDYDFATPCKKANYIKVSASMWCPACRLVFKGMHKVVL
jgi:hypothetical protein